MPGTGTHGQAARRKIFAAARGFRGRTKNNWTLAVRAVHHAWQKEYISRRQRKRDNRREWIMRINAGTRQFGLKYSHFMRGLPAAGVALDRRVLSELAAREPFSFRALVEVSKRQLAAEAGACGRAAPPGREAPEPQLR